MKLLRVCVLVIAISALVAACGATPAAPSAGSGASPTKPAPATSAAPGPDGETDVPAAAMPQPQNPSNPLAPTQAQTAQPGSTRVQPGLPVSGIELESIGERQVELVQQAGAFWVRRNALDWSKVEAQPGERNWAAVAALEADLARAGQAGLQTVLVVRGAPAWAQAQPGVWCGLISAQALPGFAKFMHDVAARYSQAPYHVMLYEMGNEPDIAPELVPPDQLFGCMGDLQDKYYGGGNYAELLKAVYPQIKAVDPQAQVLVGGLLLDCDPVRPVEGKDCTPARYLEGILAAGGGDYFDGVSFHAYDYYGGQAGLYSNPGWHSASDINGPALQPKARYLQSVLNQYNFGQKFLINTEAGLLCGRDGSEQYCQAEDFLLSKAAYLAEANFSALAEGLRANIWYSLTGWRGTGLLGPDGQPNQAFIAAQFSAQQLKGAVFQGAVTDFPAVRGYAARRGAETVWLLISNDGEQHTVSLPFTPSQVYDMFGAALPTDSPVEIGMAPVYVIWPGP